MSICDQCKNDVVHVWKHRRPAETMTHRTTEWVCASCHPRMSDQLAARSPAE